MQEKKQLKSVKAPRVVSKIVDVPILFACLFAIGIFAVIIYCSAFQSLQLIQSAVNWQGKIFFFGILASIIWACMGFIGGFINAFGKTYRHLFSKTEKTDKKEVE
jgi:hypothetical protein